DNPGIVSRRLASGAVHFQVDVVVGGRDQDAGLLYAGGDHGLQVIERSPHPGGHLGTAALLARRDRLPIEWCVGEELGLPDDRPPQLRQQVVEMNDLVDRVRRPGLLAVPERCVRDPDFVVPGLRDAGWLESDGRDPRVGEGVAEQVRLGWIDHGLFYAYFDLACNMLIATPESRKLTAA